MLLHWLVVKEIRFQNLEYTSHLLVYLQMSRSLFETGLLLFDNSYGSVAALHNSYAVLLFYPLTAWAGARGLYAGYLLAYAAALGGVLIGLRQNVGIGERVGIAALMLGPISFWLFEHEAWGFSIELLFMPLALALATAMVKGRPKTALILAAAMCLTREDGPLLVAGLYLTRVALEHPGGLLDGTFRRRALKIVGTCVVLFALGLGFLHLQGQSVEASPIHGTPLNELTRADQRLGRALDAAWLLFTTRAGLLQLIRMTGLATALFLAGGLSLGLRRARRVLATWVLLAIPMWVLGVVAGAGYASELHGLTWGPRFAMPWALLAGIAVLSAARQPSVPPAPERRAIVIALSIVLQGALLYAARGYDVASTLATPGGGRTVQLGSEELEALWCVAKHIEPRTPLIVDAELQAAFHHQDTVSPQRAARAHAPPRGAVCRPAGRSPCERLRGEYGPAWSTTRSRNVAISLTPGIAAAVAVCAHGG